MSLIVYEVNDISQPTRRDLVSKEIVNGEQVPVVKVSIDNVRTDQTGVAKVRSILRTIGDQLEPKDF